MTFSRITLANLYRIFKAAPADLFLREPHPWVLGNHHCGFLMLHIGCPAKGWPPNLCDDQSQCREAVDTTAREQANMIGLLREKDGQTLPKLLFRGAPQNLPSPDCCSCMYEIRLLVEVRMQGRWLGGAHSS